MENNFEQLVELFRKFPGIGMRQARRFAYFILNQDDTYVATLVQRIRETRGQIHLCQESFQYFYDKDPNTTLSPLVRDPNRSKEKLMIVLKDMDLENIESTGIYQGQYFVLGGLVPMIEDNVNEEVRLSQLLTITEKRAEESGLKEIIMALPLNPEGEHTRIFIEQKLSNLIEKYHLTLSTLGRGLSTGSELEYIDRDTFESAFEGRK